MLERKARENLEAARLLLEREDPCPNAAAARAYYAAYQACWVAMADKGHHPPEVRAGVTYFAHEELPHRARQARVLDDLGSRQLQRLRELRVVADYYTEDELSAEESRECCEIADRLVECLLDEVPEDE